ncbi:hypothetical protein CSC67_17930 [Pusillimonas caeni]|uniref:hypothetical protein n=1 Tax=Pusillimonas caeni TaxID=1348472 RepID=UPI000E59F81D|nr:hypothetical protein [Pusillimonas caeni]TFL10242.1 hypothetical protein CSC67_17930 [Pusillimonas caeni]
MVAIIVAAYTLAARQPFQSPHYDLAADSPVHIARKGFGTQGTLVNGFQKSYTTGASNVDVHARDDLVIFKAF